jgi:hypothetical protein
LSGRAAGHVGREAEEAIFEGTGCSTCELGVGEARLEGTSCTTCELGADEARLEGKGCRRCGQRETRRIGRAAEHAIRGAEAARLKGSGCKTKERGARGGGTCGGGSPGNPVREQRRRDLRRGRGWERRDFVGDMRNGVCGPSGFVFGAMMVRDEWTYQILFLRTTHTREVWWM